MYKHQSCQYLKDKVYICVHYPFEITLRKKGLLYLCWSDTDLKGIYQTNLLSGYFLRDLMYFFLSLPQGRLYASSFSELVEVPVANCSNYQSCGECVLSRDPYCGWNGKQCTEDREANK